MALQFSIDNRMYWYDFHTLTYKEIPCRLTEEHFTLEKDYPEAFRKVYTANIGPLGEDCLVEVHAPEMAELYAGNHLIGAAFWPPQRFTVPACLLQGPAGGALRLVLTGSKANQYGNAPVPYGLALKPAEDK